MTNDELREITGSVQDDRPLVGFLYDLLRDRVSPGDVESLVRGSEPIGPDNPCRYTNGHLARYAQLLAGRLVRESIPPAVRSALREMAEYVEYTHGDRHDPELTRAVRVAALYAEPEDEPSPS